MSRGGIDGFSSRSGEVSFLHVSRSVVKTRQLSGKMATGVWKIVERKRGNSKRVVWWEDLVSVLVDNLPESMTTEIAITGLII